VRERRVAGELWNCWNLTELSAIAQKLWVYLVFAKGSPYRLYSLYFAVIWPQLCELQPLPETAMQQQIL